MSDEQLIKIVLSGNSDAFRQLVERYQPKVFRVAMGFAHVKEDAEDITQDVFIQLFNSLKSFQGKSEFSTWLYRITLNTSLNFLKKNKWRHFFIDTGENLKNIFNHSNEEKDAQQQMETSEREQIIKKVIDQLPEKQRTAFVLSKYEELSQREIAKVMETTEGAIEQLLQRAKGNLQKKLATLVGK